MRGVTCDSTAVALCSRRWCAFGVVLGGKQRGFNTSGVSDTLELESVQSVGGLRPYPIAGPSAFPRAPFDVMKPAAAGGLRSLETEPNTSQGGSIFGCRAAGIGLQAASC